jgi:tRNA-specific 2-thiouridylase
VTAPDGSSRLRRGVDAAKDQSYVLYPLRDPVLSTVMFPVGELTKAQVRAIAAERGLRTADKPDSQDVCFVTRAEGRTRFLGDRIPLRPARVVTVEGSEVGHVDAVETVTIGQRRGLQLAGGAARRFVVDVDTGSGVVTVGSEDELLRGDVVVDEVVWASGPRGGRHAVQVSAHGEATDALVRIDGPRVARVCWDEPRRRVAPGQSVVLYDGDEVVGGGIAR